MVQVDVSSVDTILRWKAYLWKIFVNIQIFEVLANMWRRWQKSNANSEFVEAFYEFLN
jgi:hypothetical protein